MKGYEKGPAGRQERSEECCEEECIDEQVKAKFKELEEQEEHDAWLGYLNDHYQVIFKVDRFEIENFNDDLICQLNMQQVFTDDQLVEMSIPLTIRIANLMRNSRVRLRRAGTAYMDRQGKLNPLGVREVQRLKARYASMGLNQ